jgi:transposase InsO family protein
MVTCLPEFEEKNHGICRGCALRKNTNVAFPSNQNSSKGIFHLVHSDVCGSMLVPSSNAYRYYVLFIDDYSRRTWIFFMKTKDEVFGQFKEFRALVENHTWKKIKVLRSDNEGEYTSNEFKDFCKEEGIKSEMTMHFNPQ